MVAILFSKAKASRPVWGSCISHVTSRNIEVCLHSCYFLHHVFSVTLNTQLASVYVVMDSSSPPCSVSRMTFRPTFCTFVLFIFTSRVKSNIPFSHTDVLLKAPEVRVQGSMTCFIPDKKLGRKATPSEYAS